MTDIRKLLHSSLVIAAARAWVGTPYHPAQAARGLGCDCVGLLRGVFFDLTGQLVPPPPWCPDWRSAPGTIARALSSNVVAQPLDSLAPGRIAVWRVGEEAAAHVGIVTGEGRAIHAADGAPGKVVEDRRFADRPPSSVWALPAPKGYEAGNPHWRPGDLTAVIYPDREPGAGVFAEICGPEGTPLTRTRHWADVDAALADLDALGVNIETME